jgi:predicted HD phosphohydrolase
MSQDEVDRFRTRPYFQEAVRLRRWDDAAKVVGMKTPALEDFAHFLDLVLEADA